MPVSRNRARCRCAHAEYTAISGIPEIWCSGQIALAKDRIRNDMRRRRAALSSMRSSHRGNARICQYRSSAIVRYVQALRDWPSGMSDIGLIAAYRAVRGELSLDTLTEGEQWSRFTFPRVNGHDLGIHREIRGTGLRRWGILHTRARRREDRGAGRSCCGPGTPHRFR